MRSGLLSLLHFCEQEPALARLCVVDLMAAGPKVLDRRKELLKQLARLVDEGRAAARNEPPPLAAEAVVGGVLSVIHRRLVVSDGSPFIEMFGPLMSIIVLPYRGGKIAHRELRRLLPIDVGGMNGSASATDRVEGPKMRLTYRRLECSVPSRRSLVSATCESANARGLLIKARYRSSYLASRDCS
jgi:hypothetical protein